MGFTNYTPGTPAHQPVTVIGGPETRLQRQRSHRTSVIFAARSFVNGGAHGMLPRARAWRIVARPAAEYAAGSPAVTSGGAAQAPVGCADGAYPVWVRLTDPTGRAPDAELFMVNGEGWQFEETGPRWRIEAISAAGADAQRFAYAVETLDDPAAAHPIPANVTNNVALNVPPAVTDSTLAKAYGKPAVGGSGAIVLDGTDKSAATTPGRLLQLTAVGGDAFYAVDADSTIAANKVLILDGQSAVVTAGNFIHATQGPNVGGSLYFAQLVP
jgi:hypothetical protein